MADQIIREERRQIFLAEDYFIMYVASPLSKEVGLAT